MSEAEVGTAPPATTTTAERRVLGGGRARPVVVAAVACAVVAALVVAVAASSGDDDGTAPATPVVIEGAERFFSATVQDWVSFADAVVVVEATAERRLPPTPDEVERGEGYVGRVVTLEVADVLWQRPGGATPATFDIVTAGWAIEDGREVPARLRDAEHITPGSRYLVPVLRLDGEGWLPLAPTAILRVDGAGRAVVTGPRDERSEAVAAVEGRTLDEVADVLATTAPHPEVASVSPSASPIERMAAVYGEFG